MATRKKIIKIMGNYCAAIWFGKDITEWRGYIWEGTSPVGVNYIYVDSNENLNKLLELIDKQLCFYNNKDLELTNKTLPTGWHREEN